MYIDTLYLNNFRNYDKLELEVSSKFIIISGDNGVGKTNILEAVSLLSPGRGLRGVKFNEMINYDQQLYHQWGIICKLSSSDEITTGCILDKKHSSRIIKINCERVIKQEQLLQLLRVMWLIPQMNNLFLESNTSKRKTLDRIVYNIYPQHVSNINKYNYYLQCRNKLLYEHYDDASLFSNIEKQLSELYIVIAELRVKAIGLLQQFLNTNTTIFLRPEIRISGFIENKIIEVHKDELLQLLITKYHDHRADDKKYGKTSIGAHKTEFDLYHREKQISARICSTGEQKAMLISLILSQAKVIFNHYNIEPILLLDEVFAYIDSNKVVDFIKELEQVPGQIWITTANSNLYNEFNKSLHYTIPFLSNS